MCTKCTCTCTCCTCDCALCVSRPVARLADRTDLAPLRQVRASSQATLPISSAAGGGGCRMQRKRAAFFCASHLARACSMARVRMAWRAAAACCMARTKCRGRRHRPPPARRQPPRPSPPWRPCAGPRPRRREGARRRAPTAGGAALALPAARANTSFSSATTAMSALPGGTPCTRSGLALSSRAPFCRETPTMLYAPQRCCAESRLSCGSLG